MNLSTSVAWRLTWERKKGEKPVFQTWSNSRTHVSSVSSTYVSFIKKSLGWPGPSGHPILIYPMLSKKNETGKASDISYIRDYNFLCLYNLHKRYVIWPSSCLPWSPQIQIGASGMLRECLAGAWPDVWLPRAVMSAADQWVFWVRLQCLNWSFQSNELWWLWCNGPADSVR